MAYYTQDATVGTEVNRFYGDQAAHSHETGVDFSKAIKAIMKLTYPAGTVEMGHFKSNQSKIPTGGRRVVQLFWRRGGWTNAAAAAQAGAADATATDTPDVVAAED